MKTQINSIHKNIKKGYEEYSPYFWIFSISAVLSDYFGLGGLLAFVFSITMFFWLGKFHKV